MSDERKDDGGPVVVWLVTGERVLVDRADWHAVSESSWRLGRNGYVYRVGERKRGGVCLMHRLIVAAGRGQEVHHRNGDKTDNRRCNLEVTTPSAHQRDHHAHVLAARNRASRVYPTERECVGCGRAFTVHPDHRGRNRYCSRACGNKYKWSKPSDAMLAARKAGER